MILYQLTHKSYYVSCDKLCYRVDDTYINHLILKLI